MKIEELHFNIVFPIDAFIDTDPAALSPGWYNFVGSGGCIIMEVRSDGTARSAIVGSTPAEIDLDYYFREGHNWF